MAQKRDKHGRFTSAKDHTTRNRAIGAAAAVGTLAAIGAGVVAAFRSGLIDRAGEKAREQLADAAGETATTGDKPDGTLEHPYDFRPEPLVEMSNDDKPSMAAAE